MFRQDRTNPSTAVSNWRGRLDTLKGWPSTAVSTWLNGGLFGAAGIVDGAYWFGGSTALSSSIEKSVFATDATATIAATLTEGMNSGGGFGNGQTAGYIAGNDWGTPNWGRDYIGKLTFVDDAYGLIVATLSEITWGDTGLANSGTAGYYAGGQGRSGASSVILDKIDKLLFSNDSCGVITPTLSQNVYYPTGAANSGTAGYWLGGTVASGTSRIDKTTFSDDTTADSGEDLSAAGQYMSAMANSGTAAYSSIGLIDAGGGSKTVNKLVFSGEVVSNLGNLLDTTGYGTTSAGQKGSHGYFVGGYDSVAAARIDTIEKLEFTGDTCAAVTPTLPSATGFQMPAACDIGMVS